MADKAERFAALMLASTEATRVNVEAAALRQRCRESQTVLDAARVTAASLPTLESDLAALQAELAAKVREGALLLLAMVSSLEEK